MDQETQEKLYADEMGLETLKAQKEKAEKMRCKCKLDPRLKQIPGNHHHVGCRLYVAGLRR